MLQTNGCRTDNQERLQSMLATTTPRFDSRWHPFDRKKMGLLWCLAQGASIHFGTAWFYSAPQRRHFCHSKQRGSNFRAPRLGFWLFGLEQRGSVFFPKLASCIAVFGGAWHANSPIEGGNPGNQPIALSCLIKSNKTNRNDDWNRSVKDPSCVSNHFESLSVHVASYFGKFLRKDRKTSEGR